jgi:hypothetical protein
MMHNDVGHIGSRRPFKGSKISISGHKCHLKLKIGAESAKCVNVEGIRYLPKELHFNQFLIFLLFKTLLKLF